MDNSDNTSNISNEVIQNQIETTKNDDFKKYCENLYIMRIIRAGFWDDDNAIYCEKCHEQVNYWKNPFGDLRVFVERSFSSCKTLSENLYNELSPKDKLLFEKCSDCFIYKKIGVEKKEIKHPCTCKKRIFKFSNGVILDDNNEDEENKDVHLNTSV